MSGDLSAARDGELALAWRKGDAGALRVLVDRHRSAAFGLALHLCGNRDKAEDLAQEAFLRAISRLHQYNTEEPFRPWLFRILARLHIDQLRRIRETGEEPPEMTAPIRHTESDLYVQSVLDTLSLQHRTVLVLREIGGLSYEELARYFAIPVGTVRSRLAHARVAFKDAYARLAQEVAR